MGSWLVIGALVSAAMLLVAGLLVRGTSRWFTIARIPVSLIAGLIGLLLWQAVIWTTGNFDLPRIQSAVRSFEAGPMSVLSSWPGWLIAVVFAGMLLAKTDNHNNDSGLTGVARQGLMVWIIVIGQTTVGLWITWLLIQPNFDLPNSTAMLVETGFAGGHGTAAAMGTVYQSPTIGLAEGLDLGILMATSGLVYGLLAGVVLVNIGVVRHWLASPTNNPTNNPTATLEDDPQHRDSIESGGPSSLTSNLPPGTPNTTPTHPPDHTPGSIAEAIEPLLLQAVWLVLAFGIGFGLQALVGYIAAELDHRVWAETMIATGEVDTETDASKSVLQSRLGFASVVGSFPLFIYTLFGGWIVRVLVRLSGVGHWISPKTIQALCGASMDLLVVAAVTTLNLQAVASLWVPFACLFIGGIIWSTFCLVAVSRKVLPASHWFELGLINFGMSTGTTATGFVLLRMVDPDLKTRAAEEYALAAPISAPFIGGGMITVALPLLLLERIPIGISTLGFTIALAGLILAGVLANRRSSTAS